MRRQSTFKKVIGIVLVLACFFSVSTLASVKEEPVPGNADINLAAETDSFVGSYRRSLLQFYRNQVVSAYNDLLVSTNRDNFRGYCAMYVNNLLVYYGVNQAYIKGNANSLFSIYSKKTVTDSGYTVESFSAKNYTLKEALSLFTFSEVPQEKILVLFSKGPTEKGKEFGHVFFVNAIIEDKIVFSESSPSYLSHGTIPDGNPLVLTVDEVCDKYEYYKFEGLIHFTSISEPQTYSKLWRGRNCCYPLLCSGWSRR